MNKIFYIGRNKKILILFSESNNTINQENIDYEIIFSIYNVLNQSYQVSLSPFINCPEKLIEYLQQYDLVFNLCYGYYKPPINILQADIIKLLDEGNVKHTTTKYNDHLLCMDKMLYPDVVKNIQNIKSPNQDMLLINGPVIQKDRFGGCHRNVKIYTDKSLITNPDIQKHIYQEYIVGREFTVATFKDLDGYKMINITEVIGNNNNNEFWYMGHNTKLDYTPKFPINIKEHIQQIVLDISTQLNLIGLIRFDIKMDCDNNLYLLDINPMPNIDFTMSFIKNMVQLSEYDFNDIILKTVQLSL